MTDRAPAQPRSVAERAARLHELTADMGEAITLDGLTRDFAIYQRRRGHRHSTDDLLTAWYAVTHAPASVTSLLDLGSGIGSIGLSLAWRFPGVPLTALEVQGVSFRLLTENIWVNGVGGRVRAIHGDLRASVPPGAFDLITGSPPYFDVNDGIVSPDPQRAGARFELHGDVRDYCAAAARSLAVSGRFVFCFPSVQRARAESACAAAGLDLLATRDVIPRDGLPPLFSLFACGREPTSAIDREAPLLVRDAAGVHTAEMNRARAVFGMGSD